MTRTSSFDFGSGLDEDPAYQWNTKCKPFSRAEVRALTSAILVTLAEGEGVAFGSVCLFVYLSVCLSTQNFSVFLRNRLSD